MNKDILNVMNSIPLTRVLDEIMGGESNIDGNKDKWKIDTGDKIQVNGEKWYNWNRQKVELVPLV